MKAHFLLASSSLLALLVACSSGGGGIVDPGSTSSSSSSSSGGPGGGAFSLSANNASVEPDGTKVVVLWSVSSGSPDYVYAFGSGTITGGKAAISFPSDPPAEALNAATIGIGFLAVVQQGELPQGKVADFDDGSVRAVSAQHAVIYRAKAEKVLQNGWDASFPIGFACGKCVPKDEGFDEYAVEDCSAVVLDKPDAKFCNWT